MPHPILPIRASPSNDQEASTRTMKAVQWAGHVNEMVVRDIPRPRITKDSEILVRITTAAICGTDLHTYHGLTGGTDIPYIMGHEAVGIVVDVGKGITEYKAGDRVVVLDSVGFSGFESEYSPIIYGLGNLFGADIGGLQAEYAVAPNPGIIRKIPSGFDNELDYLTCADIFPTGWWSVTQTGFEAGDVVAVYGAGPMGLLAAYSALLRGASKVYAIDRVPSRLAKAKEIGAVPIDLGQGLPSEQILKLEPGGVKRICDCVGFECVNVQGEPDESFILNDAVALVAQDGGIALTGVYYSGEATAGQPLISPERGHVQFDIAGWWLKNASIRGGAANLTSVDSLLKLIENGRARPGFVFDTIAPIEEAPEAYRSFSERKIQKAAIRFFP